MTLCEWAQFYTGLGWRVLPVVPRKKAPLLENWPRAASSDIQAVTGWWGQWPGANVGIATGKGSDLVDIETDIKGAVNGEERLFAWAESIGFALPDTWSFRSGGGGIHRLFRCGNPEVLSRAGVLPCVDVRANGGQSVFPPSVHPNGRRYEWLPGHSPQDMPQGLASLPFELYALLMENTAARAPLEIPAEIIEGGRNDTIFRAACKLRRDGLSEDEILGAVSIMNDTRCSPPLADGEVERICRQAAKYEAGALPGTAGSVGPLLVPVSSVEAKRASYLISPYLPQGMLVIMGGVSGAGKTYLILSWAAAVSRGQRLPFQDCMSPTPPAGYVYYFTQENDANTVIRPRLDLLGADLDRILIQASEGTYEPITLNDPRLEEATKIYPPAMVIFDPIQSYLGARVEMNKANEVRPVLDWLGDYAKRHNCTVVLVSHMSKPGMGNTSALDRLLGSSDFRNAARSIIVVGKDPDDKESRVFAHGKNSIGPLGESHRYHIDGTTGVVYDGVCDLTADDIVKQSNDGHSKPAVTLTNAMRQLENLMGPNGCATLEQVEALQAGAGISQRTLYNARKELALQTVSIGQPPNRKTWWIRADVDEEQFKAEHTPP